MDKQNLVQLLKGEIERTVGCTDPVSIALAVSRAARELGTIPHKIVVMVSPSLYKNAINVGIPGLDKRGVLWAAALGAVIDQSEAGLAILDNVGKEDVRAAETLLQAGRVRIEYGLMPDVLYIRAEVFAGDDRATVITKHDYAHIVEVSRNGIPVYVDNAAQADEVRHILAGQSIQELVRLIETIDVDALGFLIDAAQINRQAAMAGINNAAMQLGPALWRRPKDLPTPFAQAAKAQALTGAASEARMLGLKVPVMAVTGSGNQGITNFLGVLSVAEDLGVDRVKLAHALAISSLITIYIKSLTERLTVFCGAAVAAATGVSAATVYLLGGDYAAMAHAMQSTSGTFAGILCDGAKVSCAYKISTAISAAVQFAYLAVDSVYVPEGDGIVAGTIEDTFSYLGQLNRPGMEETDAFVLKTIERIQKTQDGV
ncbi:MAG: serine dehydratase subunit alpha family protein [Anaerolineae bacterium]|nr:serine dehydratase subunit alpha family protein [Anaerolineae bacterium]